MQQPEDTTTAGPLALSLHAGLGPNATERAEFLAWLRAYAGGGDNWRGNVLMGEHDIALALWKDLRRAHKSEADNLRSVAQRLMTGIDHLDKLAREWEPDHSSGADRRGWMLAKDTRDEAARILGPNVI